jgi:hypothetical protein
MYNYNITTQELSDYNADMVELSTINRIPTEAEMEEMYVDDLTHEHNGYWSEDSGRWEWRDNETDALRAYIEWDKESQSYCWINAECDHGECQYDAGEIDLAKAKAMEDWAYFHSINERWGW